MITLNDFPKTNINQNNFLKCINHPNKFYCDLDLYNKLYNKSLNKQEFIKYFQSTGILKGEIINKEQFHKLFPNQEPTAEFVKKNITNNNYNNLSQNIIKSQIISLNQKSFQTIVLLHIGNAEIGYQFLNRLKKINNSLLLGISTVVPIKIPEEFKNYFVINVKDLGSDIIPSIILYYQIKKHNINTSHILKLHTKSDPVWRDKLRFKLIRKYPDFIKNGKIAPNTFLQNTINENLNKQIIPNKKRFVAGTMFLVKETRFQKIFNYPQLIKASIINNYYYDNYFFPQNSPIHSLERLF